MLVIVKSGPETRGGKRGLRLAGDVSAKIVLLQNGVYWASDEMLNDFSGTAYALKEDMDLRGIGEDEAVKGLRRIDWDEFTDMMAGEDKVVGMF